MDQPKRKRGRPIGGNGETRFSFTSCRLSWEEAKTVNRALAHENEAGPTHGVEKVKIATLVRHLLLAWAADHQPDTTGAPEAPTTERGAS